MSASLFSALSLYFRNIDGNDYFADTFQSLFNSIVMAEIASLGSPKLKGRKRKRKLHFCSFDHSSAITPVDIVQDSNSYIEGCIESLVRVIQEFKKSCNIVLPN